MLSLILALLGGPRHAAPAVPVLCYHDFQVVASNDMVNTPSNFEAHLKWLKDHGYRTLTINQLVNGMSGKTSLPAKAVVLTFDDGYEGVYRYAYPLLKKYGFQGTLFLVTSRMGDVAPPMPHLTWPQIEEMDRSGVIEAEVHAHQMHVKLGRRVKAEVEARQQPLDVEADLREAKREIESHTGKRVDYIAWPHGDYNEGLIRIASGLGYKAMINTEYGVNRTGDNVQRIKRLRMSSKYDNLKRFQQKLAQYIKV